MWPLEVTWIQDAEIKPPGPKMVVCVQPDMGFFFRINSENHWSPCVPIIKAPHHEFLKHDSFIQCRILDLDDYVIGEALKRSGVIGTVSPSLCGAMLAALGGAGHSKLDRDDIRAVLEPLIR